MLSYNTWPISGDFEFEMALETDPESAGWALGFYQTTDPSGFDLSYPDNAKANGGVTSVTIDNETIKDDKAKVTATLTNGNGVSSTKTYDLIKQDGVWVISIDDSKINAAPE